MIYCKIEKQFCVFVLYIDSKGVQVRQLKRELTGLSRYGIREL